MKRRQTKAEREAIALAEQIRGHIEQLEGRVAGLEYEKGRLEFELTHVKDVLATMIEDKRRMALELAEHRHYAVKASDELRAQETNKRKRR
jgi:hypothetical protein